MRKKIYWIVFLIILFVLAYWREVIFKSINAVIAGSDEFYAKTTRIDYFVGKNNDFLVQLKYLLTVGFTMLFALVTSLGLKISFTNKLAFVLSITVYGACAVIAGIVIVFSFITNSFESVYSFLRLIIEYLHNPLVYIILSASFLGYSYSQKQSV